MTIFDLDLAVEGVPVCTVSGKPVRILCFDRKDPAYPIVGLVLEADGNEEIEGWSKEGKIDAYVYRESENDLCMADPWGDDSFGKGYEYGCKRIIKMAREYIRKHSTWDDVALSIFEKSMKRMAKGE